MEKNKKIIIMILCVAILIGIIIASTLLDHKENKKQKNTNTISTNKQVVNSNEVDSEEQIIKELDGKPVAITYENETEEYKIDGTDHTIKVNQSYAKVISDDDTIKENLQEELDKIANGEFSEYKKMVEEQLHGEYPIDADFMEYVGDLSLGWNFENSRIDKGIISIKNQSSGGLGGVSWENKRGYSFNALTGKRITIEELSINGKNLKSFINSELRSYISKNAQRLGLYEETMSNFDQKVNIDNLTWYLSDDGFTVCFDKYQICPDTFEYTIPYDKLIEYMQINFFK